MNRQFMDKAQDSYNRHTVNHTFVKENTRYLTSSLYECKVEYLNLALINIKLVDTESKNINFFKIYVTSNGRIKLNT